MKTFTAYACIQDGYRIPVCDINARDKNGKVIGVEPWAIFSEKKTALKMKSKSPHKKTVRVVEVLIVLPA